MIDNTKDWYYVQAFKDGNGYGCKKTIVFADSKKQAIKKIKDFTNGYSKFYLYKNNYKPEARAMVASNNYIK